MLGLFYAHKFITTYDMKTTITNKCTGWSLMRLGDHEWVMMKDDTVIFQYSLNENEWRKLVSENIGLGTIKGLEVEINF